MSAIITASDGTTTVPVVRLAVPTGSISSNGTIDLDGGGDVIGPSSATDNAVARFDGTTGKLLQNSGVSVDDSNNITGVASLTATANLIANGIVYIGVASSAGSKLDSLGISNVVRLQSGADGTSPVWIVNTAGNTRVTADVTNATATMSNITDLSVPVIAGRSYTGRYVFKCSDSTAAEGIRFDFDGGSATMTAFAAGAGLITGGVTVASVTVSSALATDLIWTTITGETWIAIEVAFTVNAGGTFIPRFCQGTAHTSGTATVSRGSNGQLVDSL